MMIDYEYGWLAAGILWLLGIFMSLALGAHGKVRGSATSEGFAAAMWPIIVLTAVLFGTIKGVIIVIRRGKHK